MSKSFRNFFKFGIIGIPNTGVVVNMEHSGKEAVIVELTDEYVKQIDTNEKMNPLGFELTDDEKIDIAAASILQRFRHAFEELAK